LRRDERLGNNLLVAVTPKVKTMHIQPSEDIERKRRLARLKVERAREEQFEMDRRDEVRDPEYEPGPSEPIKEPPVEGP
jgi:hypothetical protein